MGINNNLNNNGQVNGQVNNNNKGETKMSNNKVIRVIGITAPTFVRRYGRYVLTFLVVQTILELFAPYVSESFEWSGDGKGNIWDKRSKEWVYDYNTEDCSAPMHEVSLQKQQQAFLIWSAASSGGTTLSSFLILQAIKGFFPESYKAAIPAITLIPGSLVQIGYGIVNGLFNTGYVAPEWTEGTKWAREYFKLHPGVYFEGDVPAHLVSNPDVVVIPVVNNEDEEDLLALYKEYEDNHEVQEVFIPFTTYGNSEAVEGITVSFNREEGIIQWRENRRYKINTRLIKVSKVRDEEGRLVNQCKVVTVSECINIIISTLKSKASQSYKATKFLNEIVGTVLRSDWEYSDQDLHNYNRAAIQLETETTVDIQQVLRDSAVVCFHVDSKGNMLSGEKYGWVEGCLELSTAHWGFALPDKTNTKRAIVGDGVVVSGRSSNGKLSIVKDDKATKQLNREAMMKHIAAEIPNDSLGADNLVTQLSDGRFAISYGYKATSLLINDPLMSASNGDAQIINREPINFIVNKRIVSSINIDSLFNYDKEYGSTMSKYTRKEQVALVIKDIKEFFLKSLRLDEVNILQPSTSIVWKGQELFNNNQVFPISIYSIKVMEGELLNTECRTVNIEYQCKAEFNDYNVKLRGQWVKGMTSRVDGYQVEGNNTQLILNHNSIKNEKGVALRAWANAKGHLISWTGEGKLYYVTKEGSLGEEVNLETVESQLVEMTKTYKVTNVISKEDYETFYEANPNSFSNVKTLIEGEIVTLTYEVQGIEAPMVYAVELSSVQENLSLNRQVSPDRASFITTFGMDKVDAELASHVAKVAKTLKEAGENRNPANPSNPLVFNANNPDDKIRLSELLTNRVNLPTRDLFKALAQVSPEGIKLLVSTEEGKRASEVVINFSLLGKLSSFKNDGYSHNAQIKNIHTLLCLVSDPCTPNTSENLVVEYVINLGKSLEEWKKDINNSGKAFTKGNSVFKTHGMKVLSASVVKDVNGKFLPSYEKVEEVDVPILWINSNNPLALKYTRDKNGNRVKPLRSGDIILGYRNPMMDLTPMIIRFNDSACDKFTCAVSPTVLAWSSQTDNDGDTFWVIPTKQFCVNNVDGSSELAISSRRSLTEMFKHPLVGKQVAVDTMKAFKCEDLFAGIIKPRSNFSVKGVIGESECNIVELAEKVATHYKQRIGQGYAMMFNAYSSFVTKYNKARKDNGGVIPNFSVFSEEDILAIKACSFVFYEEIGLAGYSAENEAKFVTIDRVAKEHLGRIKTEPRSILDLQIRASISDLQAEDMDKLPTVIHLAALYRAQGIIQSELERGEIIASNGTTKTKGVIKEAVSNGLFRTLTKGHLNYGGDNLSNIFSANFTVDADHPYAPALAVFKSFVQGGLIK
jgi:hypothetical protein